MDDPDNINRYWDSLPERTPEDDDWSFDPPKLRVVDASFTPDGKPDRLVRATPFTWRPTADIPKRRWLYGKHLLRKFVSLDVA
ncbi:hypothetical protein ACO1NG_14465, partial [Staphylococcus aureus]